MSDLMAAALACAARGWHVFPLRPNDKRPAYPDHPADTCKLRDRRCAAAGRHVGWEPRATTDPDRIRRAWALAPFNVGIACGPSGLVVVDLDTAKPDQTPPAGWDMPGVRDGGDVFTVVCERAGHPAPFDTHTVTTGRGGTHLYYRHPTGGPALRSTAGTLGWLVDTRAHGGYVVAAGSIVARRPYTTTHDTDPAPLPNWLAGALAPAPLPPQRPVTATVHGGRHSAYLTAALTRQAAHVTDAPAGQRNRALYLAAVALGQLVAGGALTADDVTATLTAAAQSAGLARVETARTIASGLRAGAGRPRTVAA